MHLLRRQVQSLLQQQQWQALLQAVLGLATPSPSQTSADPQAGPWRAPGLSSVPRGASQLVCSAASQALLPRQLSGQG